MSQKTCTALWPTARSNLRRSSLFIGALPNGPPAPGRGQELNEGHKKDPAPAPPQHPAGLQGAAQEDPAIRAHASPFPLLQNYLQR